MALFSSLSWSVALALMTTALAVVVVSAVVVVRRAPGRRVAAWLVLLGYGALWAGCFALLVAPVEVHAAVLDVPAGTEVSCFKSPVDVAHEGLTQRTPVAETCLAESRQRTLLALGGAAGAAGAVAVVLLWSARFKGSDTSLRRSPAAAP